jgi:hypothetical protein
VEIKEYLSGCSDSNFSLISNELSIHHESDFDALFYTKHSKDRSIIQAKAYCSRLPGYYIFNAFLLIFLITLSALTVFAINSKFPQGRLQTTCTLMLTSVSLKWVTNRYLILFIKY